VKEKHPEHWEHRGAARQILSSRTRRGELGGRDPAPARALDSVSLHHADRRVLIVCHQVVVLCIRYILEEMDEAQILAIDRKATCSIAESRNMIFSRTMLGSACRSSPATISRRR
jgi:hypothetical protein